MQQRLSKIRVNRIPEEIITLAEILKEAGYATYSVACNINISRIQGFDQGFDRFQRIDYYQDQTLVNKQLQAWVDEIRSQKKYFLYIHYMDPHQPYHKREPWFGRYRQEARDPLSNLVARYDSEINFVDQKIQQMFQRFGWDKNTLMVITSDHGEEFKEHGRLGHGKTLYSEVLHVPLMLYHPGGGIPGKVVDTNVSLVDVAPTITSFVGIPADENHMGLDLLALA
ncbi:unnamed protein product, partial [marine sediment metagenome]